MYGSTDSVTCGQTAVFLIRTFDLALEGPRNAVLGRYTREPLRT
jgi:hypothetical protein